MATDYTDELIRGINTDNIELVVDSVNNGADLLGEQLGYRPVNQALNRANRDIISYLFNVLKERGLLYDPINFPIDVGEYELPYSMMILNPLQHGRLYNDFIGFLQGNIDHIPTQAEIEQEEAKTERYSTSETEAYFTESEESEVGFDGVVGMDEDRVVDMDEDRVLDWEEIEAFEEQQIQREEEEERQREEGRPQYTINNILAVLGQQGGHLVARRLRQARKNNIIPERLDTIVCKLGMDLLSQDNFDSQLLDALQQQRYQQAREGTIPDTVLGFIDNSTGHVLCVVKEQELAYWNSKAYKYKGVIADNQYDYQLKQNTQDYLFFMNFSLWPGHFFLRYNLDIVINSNTNIFLVVKTNKKFYDINNRGRVGAFHNYDRNGDYIHIIIPIE
jgi:hypothetical protein